jgi:hypothetical protein
MVEVLRVRRSIKIGVLVMLSAACASLRQPVEEPCWDAQPTTIEGTVFVAPPLVATELPTLNLTGFLGEELQGGWAAGRIRRTAQIAELPYAVADALPGQLHRIFPGDWAGHFRPNELNSRRHRALVSAALGGENLNQMLSETAKKWGGGGSLFVWITALDGYPLTESTMSGELVFHRDLPVIVGLDSEPYKVEISLGAALFDSEGVLAFRYADHYEALLSTSQNLDHAAHQLAESLVSDLQLIWPQDPDLNRRRLVQNH